MRKITCADCGKHYDFDKDDFCPRCGSFNQPPNSGATRLEQELLSRFSSGQARQTGGRSVSAPVSKGRPAAAPYAAPHAAPQRGAASPLTPKPKKKSAGGVVVSIVALLFCLLVILPLVLNFLGGLLRAFLFMFT